MTDDAPTANAPPDTATLDALLGSDGARPWYRRAWPWLLLAALLGAVAAGGGGRASRPGAPQPSTPPKSPAAAAWC